MRSGYIDSLIEEIKANKGGTRAFYLFVAEKKGDVTGVAIVSYFRDENFYYVDYIASKRSSSSRGIGAALYSRIKEQSVLTESQGIFLECETTEREFCASDEEQNQNKNRLNFYRKFGAQKLENSSYENVRLDKSSLYLLFDNNKVSKISMVALKSIVKAILKSHTEKKCSKEYIKAVVDSLADSHFQMIAKAGPKKIKTVSEKMKTVPLDQKIPLTLNTLHVIHHVKEKGYVESPIRIDSILKEIDKLDYFDHIPTKSYPDSLVLEVHDSQYYKFLKQICHKLGNKTYYPDVFPLRNKARMPKGLEDRSGYYCMDTFTPLNLNAFLASRAAVNCALTAASKLIEGENIAYALVRPPGHHAEKKFFGGFCYLNSTAIAANFLSKEGRVAILDLDFHHGNGQQNIFYKRDDVLTISIHGHPEHAYPHFTGFAEEKGAGKGLGFNINHPLRLTIGGDEYRKALNLAILEIEKFNPAYCVIALGLDTAKGDPTGTWKLLTKDFKENGIMIGSLKSLH